MWCWQLRMTNSIAVAIRAYGNSYTYTIDIRGFEPLLQ